MTKKFEDLELLLAELTSERNELEAAIDAMIGAMANASLEQRKSGDWASDGASTQRYLEQSNRLAEVEQAIVDLSRRLAAARTSST